MDFTPHHLLLCILLATGVTPNSEHSEHSETHEENFTYDTTSQDMGREANLSNKILKLELVMNRTLHTGITFVIADRFNHNNIYFSTTRDTIYMMDMVHGETKQHQTSSDIIVQSFLQLNEVDLVIYDDFTQSIVSSSSLRNQTSTTPLVCVIEGCCVNQANSHQTLASLVGTTLASNPLEPNNLYFTTGSKLMLLNISQNSLQQYFETDSSSIAAMAVYGSILISALSPDWTLTTHDIESNTTTTSKALSDFIPLKNTAKLALHLNLNILLVVTIKKYAFLIDTDSNTIRQICIHDNFIRLRELTAVCATVQLKTATTDLQSNLLYVVSDSDVLYKVHYDFTTELTEPTTDRRTDAFNQTRADDSQAETVAGKWPDTKVASIALGGVLGIVLVLVTIGMIKYYVQKPQGDGQEKVNKRGGIQTSNQDIELATTTSSIDLEGPVYGGSDRRVHLPDDREISSSVHTSNRFSERPLPPPPSLYGARTRTIDPTTGVYQHPGRQLSNITPRTAPCHQPSSQHSMHHTASVQTAVRGRGPDNQPQNDPTMTANTHNYGSPEQHYCDNSLIQDSEGTSGVVFDDMYYTLPEPSCPRERPTLQPEQTYPRERSPRPPTPLPSSDLVLCPLSLQPLAAEQSLIRQSIPNTTTTNLTAPPPTATNDSSSSTSHTATPIPSSTAATDTLRRQLSMTITSDRIEVRWIPEPNQTLQIPANNSEIAQIYT